MYKILIVDDEAEIRNGYARFFPWGQQGFEVAGTASNAEQAIAALESSSVDLMLCDIVMPKVDGLALAEIVERDFPRVRIIILSGYGDFEYARRAIRRNVFAYVLKSDKHEVLIETLARLKAELDAELAAPSADLTMDAIEKYVQEHYSDASLTKAADIAHMSPNYFCKVFKEKTGVNFHAYVIQVRLAAARRLLENTNMRIDDIAERVGYSEGKNFNRIFKKVFGLSPKEYKQRRAESGSFDAAAEP
jgi:Response regulator containing CheY-like receiver domain and AraC-type DNA-binding domain